MTIATSRANGPDEDPEEFPDGGWKAWSVVIGSWCGMVPSFGLLNSIGVLQAWLASNQLKQYSESSIGWIFGVFNFFLYITGIQIGEGSDDSSHEEDFTNPSGPVFDAHGLKYILVPGCIGLVLSLMMLSLCQGESI